MDPVVVAPTPVVAAAPLAAAAASTPFDSVESPASLRRRRFFYTRTKYPTKKLFLMQAIDNINERFTLMPETNIRRHS
ncbi:uncharacterized protein DFE_0711 [Desulfovibrio ferrophilus]|uniref:Uncharacterized protein n=1 Tax=Desulfovibrio ferrophilus TaxID=241368 RepID=A0A2Z6AW16_9BACT|nr:uncharacterized protein DFE_0711 [Desulfovibrio ferrophilus]